MAVLAHVLQPGAGAGMVRAGGCRVRVTQRGRGRQTVLLLHGFADNLATWDRVLPELARRRHVVAVDLPGFGESGPPARRPLLQNYVDVVDDVLDTVAAGERVAIVGNSMGGAVALAYALARPRRVDRLVLVGCAGLGDGVPLWWRVVTAELLPARAALAALRVTPPGLVQAVTAEVYARLVLHRRGSADRLSLHGFARHYRSLRDIERLAALGHDVVRELAGAGLVARAAGMQTPALLLWGRHDRLVPHAHGSALAAVMPRSRLAVIDDCGHCPQVERPDDFLAAAVPFLDGRPVVLPGRRGCAVLGGERLAG